MFNLVGMVHVKIERRNHVQHAPCRCAWHVLVPLLLPINHLHVEEALGVVTAEDHHALLVAVHADLAEQPPEHRLRLLLGLLHRSLATGTETGAGAKDGTTATEGARC